MDTQQNYAAQLKATTRLTKQAAHQQGFLVKLPTGYHTHEGVKITGDYVEVQPQSGRVVAG